MTKNIVLRTLAVLAAGGFLVQAVIAAAPKPLNFEPFEFPVEDGVGVYTMLDLTKVDKNQVETLVRQRLTRGDNLFARRIIDCRRPMRYKTLAFAGNMEGLKHAQPDTRWNTFVPGSPVHATAVAACARV